MARDSIPGLYPFLGPVKKTIILRVPIVPIALSRAISPVAMAPYTLTSQGLFA
ncbi:MULTISPECIES: hypothetical protein [unclassified Microcoleus]|uniref:hypothetical protein n=1 Tax=unclassified Microcoleus TaxID=2642155 RepID=UPI002FD3413B